jgi:hypothetical protein
MFNMLSIRSMWSDTGNEQYDSRGDTFRVTNLDALNITGPNMSNSRYKGKPPKKIHDKPMDLN